MRAMNRLTRALTTASLLFFLLPAPARAASHGPFGLGIMLGDPSGLNAKLEFSDAFGVDFGVGFALIGGRHLHIQADFHFEFDLERWAAGELELYVGVGPKLGIWVSDKDRKTSDGLRIGVRAPIGLRFELAKAPVDFFLEVAAGLWAIGGVDFDIDAALGVRYYF